MNKIGKGMTGWQDLVELAVATWIFVSPIALGFFSPGAAVLTAFAVGGVAILISELGIATQKPKLEWFTMALAVFFMLSPWIFSYAAIEFAAINAVASGAVLFTFAALSLLHETSELRKLHN